MTKLTQIGSEPIPAWVQEYIDKVESGKVKEKKPTERQVEQEKYPLGIPVPYEEDKKK